MPPARALLFIASFAAAALLLRALLFDPVPLTVAAGALAIYALLVVSGVLIPRLQMFADVVWRGPPDARGVALTFDDGPHPVHTREVLATLARDRVPATFFVLGEKVRRHPDVAREIAAAGHLLGVHGDKHDRALAFRSLKRIREDLARAVREIESATGTRPSLYRPAVGQTNPRIARAADELGLTLVGWSARGRDGIRTAPARVVRRIARRLEDGAIVLLHDAAERDDRIPAGPAALPGVLAAIAARQLMTVRLDTWLSEPPSESEPEEASHRAPGST